MTVDSTQLFFPFAAGSAMNLIAMLLELLFGSFGQRMRLQPIPLRRRARERDGSDAEAYHREVAQTAGWGRLTGSMRNSYPDAADGRDDAAVDSTLPRRSWSG